LVFYGGEKFVSKNVSKKDIILAATAAWAWSTRILGMGSADSLGNLKMFFAVIGCS